MILLEAFFGRRGSDKSLRLARTIRDEALPDGGWSQYPGGPADLSVSCLSYFALKVAGDAAGAPHLQRAREAILALGGAERANTYTKYHLAMFGQYPWRALPAIPPEMMFLPGRAPFSVYDMSSWSRTIFVPLSILWARKPVCRAAAGVRRRPSCFAPRPAATAPPRAALGLGARSSARVDRALKAAERLPGAGALRRAAVERAAAWMIERLAGSDGLSAILPAMVNSVLALKCLGHAEDDPLLRESARHLDGLLLARRRTARCAMQPCLSPVWDTVLAGHALAQAGLARRASARSRAPPPGCSPSRRTAPATGRERNPAPPGGWYFEHRNEFYPDVDDTCMALMVLRQARADGPGGGAGRRRSRAASPGCSACRTATAAGPASIATTTRPWLTQVPFADHNAMIDPSTADITGRVLECLSHFPGFGARAPGGASARSRFLRARPEPPTAPGTAAGASTTSTAPGRCCAAWPASART